MFEIEVRPDGEEWELTYEEASGKIIEVEREVPDPSHAHFSSKRKVTPEQAQRKHSFEPWQA